METLWSPWRMAFLDPQQADAAADEGGEVAEQADEAPETLQTEHPNCVFCAAVARGEASDRKTLILQRGEYNFVIMNLYPYNTAHLMVVPYRHLGDVTLLSAEEGAEMIALLQRMVTVVRGEYHPEGFNAGMNLGHVAGAGIADHIHMHLVPRWSGDTNFMPVIAQTKVMPEAIDATYGRLKRALAQSS